MRARGGVQAFISVARSSPQARYGIRSVFLATDDPSVVDEARIAATAADLPLYAMLANPPASAGTAPPLRDFFARATALGKTVPMTFDMGNWHWTGEDPLDAAQVFAARLVHAHPSS